MRFIQIDKASYQLFHDLLNDYYREGEEEVTPQAELDEFIDLLYGMVNEGKIGGRIAENEGETVGFVLWAADTEHFAFSELPGYGTIMEIGVREAYRLQGYGRRMVAFAEKRFKENAMTVCYVASYEAVESFWEKCGYRKSDKVAKSELPLMTKSI